MAKVVVHEEAPADAPAAPAAQSPSADLIQRATLDETLPDRAGRKIKVRKPGPLAQFRIVEAAGPEAAANAAYMQMVNPLIYVYEIDGLPVHLPANKREIEALITQLGEDGLDVLMLWYIRVIIGPMQEAIAAEEQKARLKNS